MTPSDLEGIPLPVHVRIKSKLGMLGDLEGTIQLLKEIEYGGSNRMPRAIIAVHGKGYDEVISLEHVHFGPLDADEVSDSDNNGGSTDYYKFDPEWVECGDVIEAREMNYNQGNIFKSAFCFNQGRHEATDATRELNKIVYFAQRELKRINNA